MHRDHISVEDMRAYLLGKLPEESAAAVEEQYFVDRAFFLEVQSVESGLISEYLEGNLFGDDKERFESRYLAIPELRRKLDQAREERKAAHTTPAKPFAPVLPTSRTSFSTGWKFAMTGAFVAIVAVSVWIYHEKRRTEQSIAVREAAPAIATPSPTPRANGNEKADEAKKTQGVPVRSSIAANKSIQPDEATRKALESHAPKPGVNPPSTKAQASSTGPPFHIDPLALPVVVLELSPGLGKGPVTSTPTLTQPRSDSNVRLTLDLPGQARPVEATISISLVRQTGDLDQIWTSVRSIRSKEPMIRRPSFAFMAPPRRRPPSPGRDPERPIQQMVYTQISGSLLTPGDYIVEVRSLDGAVQEKYVFRIVESK